MTKKTDTKPNQGKEKEKAQATESDSVVETQTPDVTTSDSVSSETNSAEAIVSTAANPTNKTAKQWPLWLVLLLIIIALGIGAWFGWQQWQEQQQKLDKLQASLQTQVEDSARERQNTFSQLQTRHQQYEQSLDALLQQQSQQQQRIDNQSQRLSSLSGTSREDWLLAEARYLLRLANQRLLVEGGIDGTVGLLEAADKILTSIDNNDLLPTRDAIAQEIVALKLANIVDREGLYLKLAALKTQIQALPLVPFIQKKESPTGDSTSTTTITSDSTSEEDTTNTWYHTVYKSFKNAFANVGKLIQVRQHDQPPQLLIGEQYQYQVISTLLLKLEQAQFALLHNENTIYQQSLQETQQWWHDYYGHYPEYSVIETELNALQNISVEKTLPNINRSLNLLTDYIERFHRLNYDDNARPTEPSQGAEQAPGGESL